MKIPEVKISVEVGGELLFHKIKGDNNISGYMNVFKSILRFNGFKEDVINNLKYDNKI